MGAAAQAHVRANFDALTQSRALEALLLRVSRNSV
jgi:hypothetical protein